MGGGEEGSRQYRTGLITRGLPGLEILIHSCTATNSFCARVQEVVPHPATRSEVALSGRLCYHVHGLLASVLIINLLRNIFVRAV